MFTLKYLYIDTEYLLLSIGSVVSVLGWFKNYKYRYRTEYR